MKQKKINNCKHKRGYSLDTTINTNAFFSMFQTKDNKEKQKDEREKSIINALDIWKMEIFPHWNR